MVVTVADASSSSSSRSTSGTDGCSCCTRCIVEGVITGTSKTARKKIKSAAEEYFDQFYQEKLVDDNRFYHMVRCAVDGLPELPPPRVQRKQREQRSVLETLLDVDDDDKEVEEEDEFEED